MSETKESRLDRYTRWQEQAQPYFIWQWQQFQPFLGKRVLDVGCGLGNFVGFFRGAEYYLGLDNDPIMVANLQKECREFKNIEIAVMDITDKNITEDLKQKSFDTVICVNVLEHIKDDTTAIQNMIAILPSGGRLCLLVPALPCLYGSLDALDGHFRRYTKKSLSSLTKAMPVKTEGLYYFNLIGALGWFLKSRIIREQQHSNANYSLMNLILPVAAGLERHWRPPLGMSLVAILSKK
ncbi:MAG: class I SAM-dependent methyltransferase [bacterium]|nr:class I SAM-dependent methyltransferase [bacterium]